MVYYSSSTGDNHKFYVLDDTIHYEFTLTSNSENIKNFLKCPKCNTTIECTGILGENIYVECSDCGETGTIEI